MTREITSDDDLEFSDAITADHQLIQQKFILISTSENVLQPVKKISHIYMLTPSASYLVTTTLKNTNIANLKSH